MTKDQEGVHPIANTGKPHRVADIVFVHGLKGASHSTWTHQREGHAEYCFWPEELGKDFPQCGVWSVGYAAGLTEMGKAGMLIKKRAQNLVSQLCIKGIGERPVIFICHSMGGLVVKAMVVAGATPLDDKHSRLVKNIWGILFCGTPHRGSAVASFAAFLGVAQKHVKEMRRNDEALDLEHQQFANWHKSNPISLLTFAESHPMKRQTWYGRIFPRVMIVPRASANFDLGPVHDVEADHLAIVKPKRGDYVHEKSKEWIDELLQSPNFIPYKSAPETIAISGSANSGILQQPPFTEIYAEFSAEKEESLKAVQKEISEGRYASAELAIRKEMGKRGVWSSLPPSTKAKAHRLLISAVLNRQLNTEEAKKLLWEARAECPNERFVTTEAFIAITDGSEKAMLETYPTPVSEEEWRWKLLLLVNNQQYEDAIRSGMEPSAPYPPSPAVHGILCWAYLNLKRLDEAHKSNEIALSSKPNDLGNLEAKALISFASAISREASNWLEPGFPQPIEPICILTSTTAIAQLEVAKDIFSDLACRMDKGSIKQLKYLSWLLASYCCIIQASQIRDPKVITNALTTFADIQNHHPYFPLAIHWALQAKLPIDFSKTEELVKVGISEKKCEALESMLQIYLHQGKLSEAAQLLDTYKPQYNEVQGQRAWRYYRVQLAGALGQKEVVASILTDAEDEEDRMRLLTFSMKAPASRGEFRNEYLKACIDLWKKTQKATDLFDACESHAEFATPEFVIDHRDKLLKLFPSQETLLIVLTSLNTAQQWQLCLDTLETHRNLLENPQPVMTQIVEFEALYQTGNFSSALALARHIAHGHPLEQNIFLWFDRAEKAGNHEHLVEASKFAIQTQNCTVELLLHMSERLVVIQIELAHQLFRVASTLPDIRNPHSAAKAFLLAHSLGITDLPPEVVQAALSPEGPVKAFTFEQTIELMQQHKNERAEQNEHYRLGNVFVHAFANSANYPISAIYHDACPPANTDYFAPPTRLWSARIRHGRRSQFATPPLNKPWKLHLDISSLLLAHRLDILSALENTGATLSISKLVPGVLLNELKQLNDRQPTREIEVDRLLALIDTGKVRVTSQAQTELDGIKSGDTPWAVGMNQDWRQAFSKAVEDGGVLIDFWPIHWDSNHKLPLEVPTQWQGNVGGPSGLIRGMIEAGWIEESEIYPKIKNHDSFHLVSPTLQLIDGENIILDSGVARVLVDIKVLDVLAVRCKVWVTYAAEQEYRESKKQALYRNAISDSVSSLQKHLNTELGRRYLVGPVSARDDQHKNDSLLFRSLLDFTAASRVDDIVLVTDDRWITGFLHFDKAPIVGLIDVLHWLHKDQIISASTFYDCLHRLRLGNARIVPLSIEEVLFRLKQATNLHTLELHETPQLEVIRRYCAACFLDAKSLQFGSPDDLDCSELQFLTRILHVVAATLAQLWAEDINQAIRHAKSSWLLHALVSDINLAIQVANPESVSSLNERWLEDLFCIFCAELCNTCQVDEIQDNVAEFASWIIQSLELAPSAFARLYGAIEILLCKRLEEEEEDAQEFGAVIRLFNHMVMGLLKSGHNHITVPAALKEKLGIITITSVGNLQFEQKAFWDAVQLAMEGQSALIHLENEQKKEFRITRRQDSDIGPCIILDDGSEHPPELALNELYLLDPDIGTRVHFLTSRRTVLDLTPNATDEVITSIVKEDSPSHRMDRYHQLKLASTTLQFKRFSEAHRGSQVTLSDIENELRPLGVSSLLQHIGFSSGDVIPGNLAQLLGDSAARLIDDYGLRVAFATQASLPVKLSDLWAERLFSLTPAQFDNFAQEFERESVSPLIRFHLSCLMMRPESAYQTRGLFLLEQIIGDDAMDAWSFFRAILQWSWRCLASGEESATEVEMILCAWLHAGVFQRSLPRPPNPSKLVGDFAKLQENPKKVFGTNFEGADVAHPLYFEAKWLLAHALPQHLPLNDLPEDLATRLKDRYFSALFPPSLDGKIDRSLLVLRGGWNNSLSSFLSAASSEALDNWLSDDQKSWIDQDTLLVSIQNYFQERKQTNSVNEWAFLAHLLGSRVAPSAIRDAVKPLLDDFSFSKLDLNHDLSAGGLWLCAHFTSLQRVWYRTEDEDFWFDHLNSFLEVLEQLNDTDYAAHALDCAWAVSVAWSDPIECAKRFADTVVRVVRRRPIIATKSWTGLSRLVQSQVHYIQVHLWPMLAEVRAVGGRESC